MDQNGAERMKLAMPVWQGRISPVLDTAGQLVVVQLERGREVERYTMPLPAEALPARARRIGSVNADVLLCGAVSRPLAQALVGQGLRLVAWVAGDAQEVLEAAAAGAPVATLYAMPGCGGGGRGTRCRARRGRCDGTGPRRGGRGRGRGRDRS